MAPKTKKTAVVAVAGATITIKDLCVEYGVEAHDLRALLRANGMKAPEIAREAGVFGPKSKYEWPADSAEVTKIRELIQTTVEADPVADPKVAAKAKKAKAAAVVAEDEAEDEDDTDEEEEAPAPKKAKKAKKQATLLLSWEGIYKRPHVAVHSGTGVFFFVLKITVDKLGAYLYNEL